jgi:hypothetical protein
MELVYCKASNPGSYGGIRGLGRNSGSPVKTAVASVAFDANRGLNLVNIHCDVMRHATVDNTRIPLLFVCNVTGKHGQVAWDVMKSTQLKSL